MRNLINCDDDIPTERLRPRADLEDVECDKAVVICWSVPRQPHVGINGFAQLTFQDDALRIDSIDVFNQTIHTERFQAEAGATVLNRSENFARSPAA